MSIRITLEGDERFLRMARMAPVQADKAIRRAMARSGRHIKSRMAREEAAAHGMPVGPLRKVRTKVGRQSGPDSRSVWFGYNPIGAGYVGGLKAAKGVADAFVATMPSGHRSVFRRVGKTRQPIEEVKVPFPQAVGVAEGLAEAFGAQAEKILVQELNYALNVEGG